MDFKTEALTSAAVLLLWVTMRASSSSYSFLSIEILALGNTKQIFKVYPIVNNCPRGLKGQR